MRPDSMSAVASASAAEAGRVGAHRGQHGPSDGFAAVRPAALQQAHPAHPERLLHPAEQCGQRLFAAQQAAGQGGQGLGLGPASGCQHGPAGRPVDDPGHQHRDQ